MRQRVFKKTKKDAPYFLALLAGLIGCVRNCELEETC